MTFPNDTGPLLETKLTTKDAVTNTGAHWNGSDANNHRTKLEATSRMLCGSYRGWVERRSLTNKTAVRVHTAMAMVDGYRKSVVSGRVLLPNTAGTRYVYIRWNPTGIAATIRTAAAEPAPYATLTRDMPLAKVVATLTDLQITHIRPDWTLGTL